MNPHAVFHGKRYHFIEALPFVDGGQEFVICADDDRSRAVCPAEVWQTNAVSDTSQVNRSSSAKEKIDFFLDLFRGCEDVYARRWYSSEPVKAADARRLGTSLLTRAMGERHELSFASYDRLFPAQDFLPRGGFGNLIALPFQGQAQREGNTLFVDERFEPYPDQWAFLSSLPRLSAGELEQFLSELKGDSDVGPLLDTESTKPWPKKRTR